MYIGAPLGLLLQSDAGVLQSVVCHTAPGASGPIRSVQAVYAPIGDQPLSRFRLRLAARAKKAPQQRVFSVAGKHSKTRGAWDIAPAPGGGPTKVDVVW